MHPDHHEHPSKHAKQVHPADNWVCGDCGSKNVIRAAKCDDEPPIDAGSAGGGGVILPGDKDGGGAI